MVAKSLEERIELLEAVHEIQNLMARYSYGGSAGRPDAGLELWAKHTPGTAVNVPSFGYYEGFEGVKRLMDAHGSAEGERIGQMYIHPLTTPLIEVAGDGKTAKGVWISPGYETQKDRETGEITSCFCYTKYGCDFVKEDGQWKMWHYHVYRIFMTPWNKGFTEGWELKREAPKPRYETQLPTTFDNPYSVDTERELVPAPPEPYETFSDTFSYGPPEKK